MDHIVASCILSPGKTVVVTVKGRILEGSALRKLLFIAAFVISEQQGIKLQHPKE